MVSFNNIPTTIRVPWTYVEFDNTRAAQGPAVQPYTTLIMGQKLSTGTKDELTLQNITSEAQALTYFGEGSMLHRMCKKYLENDTITSLKAIAIDDAAGSPATGQISFTGSSIKAGTLYLYIGGQRVTLAVAEGDTGTEIAAALNTLINATDELPVTSAVNGVNDYALDLTFVHVGAAGNDCDIRVNYADDEELPENLVVTIVDMSGGTTNPDVAEIIAVLPDDQFNVVVCPWNDSTNRALLEAEMDTRFGPLNQNWGEVFIAKAGTSAELDTYGNAGNSKHVCCMGKTGPTPEYEWAAVVGAQTSIAAQADPARPYQTLPLTGVLAPNESERFNWTERNGLLYDGIATFTVDAGGVVRIERLITMYKTNAAGADDTSYLDVNTLYTLDYLRYSFRTMMLNKYPRHKLADDGVRVGPGQAIITPKIGKAEAISLFAQWEELGLVEGIEQFKNDIIVERNTQDPNRLDFLLPPDLVNQLRVVGTQIQFLL